ncbi:MAG: hypothetical protein WBA53_00625, partial [Burkholderiaceae bacterium]
MTIDSIATEDESLEPARPVTVTPAPAESDDTPVREADAVSEAGNDGGDAGEPREGDDKQRARGPHG